MAEYNDWTTGLNSCLRDPLITCSSCFCFPFRVALNKAAIDRRTCNICDLIFCCPCQHFFNRQQIRAKYGFEQDVCADALAACLCPLCVACQNAREIRVRETHIVHAVDYS
eukprot:TRINITY_DN30721_c0_g1_i1.p1 TRINITY_DN30721_c0_g1~~TRINITY_DN30721_c0_g1_i1.p1  ORF type:complete len:111 (+),score=18.91 TRINITY_DN30721_c0_g1_i1:107-439(+)